MPNEPKLPDFDQFSRWLAARVGGQALGAERFDELQAAAREARDEFIEAARRAAPAAEQGSFEVLQLLAAADSDAALPPEIITPKGFRITLAYDEGSDTESASIGVLVNCPPELQGLIEGRTVYLWNGSERFELGQFDAEGKALGTLPAGIEITASDFAHGRIKLEAPDSP
jgi:hypothetical protein